MKSAGHRFMAATAIVSVSAAGACSTGSTASSTAPPPVFGGQGAVVRQTPAELPLPAENPTPPRPQGPCVGPARDSNVALLDDFEDGDSHLFQAFQRDGYWWSGTDATEGATIYPEVSKFAPDRLPASEATRGNLFAAHLKAAGQRDWGVTWGVGLQWVSKGIKCPLDISSFGGLKFRAKGPGTVRVAFSMPETQAKEHGGECTAGCYDFHGMVVYLDDRWADYVVPFDHLQQGGWGAQARFDPGHILGLSLAVKAKDLPIDFWVDDLSLVTAAEATALAAAERAQPVSSKVPPATAPHAGKPASPAL